ncbi:MAG: hypothetical protein A2Z83_02120 [Omnitrophica bacterium GWA2_52_8]|nr:MAG: hypothetical protein A2Z83_02120 [Omnitrophica bacterium GWA2_52_8]
MKPKQLLIHFILLLLILGNLGMGRKPKIDPPYDVSSSPYAVKKSSYFQKKSAYFKETSPYFPKESAYIRRNEGSFLKRLLDFVTPGSNSAS